MNGVDINPGRTHIHSMDQLPARLVLYDGVCGFCDRTVQWLLRHDPEGRLFFAPLQGETAKAILARHPEVPEDLDAIIFVENAGAGDDERVTWRSRAVFRICSQLQDRWRFIAWLGVFPAFLADLGYRFIAKIRHRIWGTLDQCRVPSESEKARFLP